MKPITVELWKEWGSLNQHKVDEFKPNHVKFESDDVCELYVLTMSDDNHQEEIILDNEELKEISEKEKDFVYRKDSYAIWIKF